MPSWNEALKPGGFASSRAALWGAVGLAAVLSPVLAKERERPAFRPHRFDENWIALCDPAQRSAVLDPLKCLRLAPDLTLSIGGEWRSRFEVVRNPGFGLRQPSESMVLNRALLHADLRFGNTLRGFVQLGFFDQGGRDRGPGPTDVNRFDVTQAFLDISQPIGGGQVTLRLGRQEMTLGSQRLVSARDGANIRRAFDGIRAFWTGNGMRLDAFYVEPLRLSPDAFDDRRLNNEALWGAYLTGAVPDVSGLSLDAYYLGFHRESASFATGRAKEDRHTLGMRAFGRRGRVDWDIEAAYQFGTFGSQDIRAFMVSSDLNYSIAEWPLAPRLGLKANIFSGDRSLRNNHLGTFNAMYPRLPYFSEANLVVPSNLMDLQPYLTLVPIASVQLRFGWNPLWRYTVRDAIYTGPGTAVARTAGQPGRFIGHQFIAAATWQATANLSFATEFVSFEPGEALRRAGGRSTRFLTGAATFRF